MGLDANAPGYLYTSAAAFSRAGRRRVQATAGCLAASIEQQHREALACCVTDRLCVHQQIEYGPLAA